MTQPRTTTARLGIRVSKDELEAYKKAAQADGRSVNSWIRHILNRYIKGEIKWL